MLKKIALLSCFLSACSSGGSSSSGGGDNTVTYTGTQEIILSAQGFSVSEAVAFVMDVSDNTVTIRDADFTVSTQATNNEFSVSSPTLNIPVDTTTTCTGSISYTGSYTDTNATGTLGGFFRCSGDLVLSVRGNFNGTAGNAKAMNTNNISETIKVLVR